MGRVHGLADVAGERPGEGRHVDEHAFDADGVGGMRVRLNEHAGHLRAHVGTPVLREGDEELLPGGEFGGGRAGRGSGDVAAVHGFAGHERHEGEMESAVVGGVFTEGELAVDVEAGIGEAAVLVGDAGGALVEVGLVFGGPPVVEVAVAVEL